MQQCQIHKDNLTITKLFCQALQRDLRSKIYWLKKYLDLIFGDGLSNAKESKLKIFGDPTFGGISGP